MTRKFEIDNHYLYLSETENGEVEINSSDGVFSSFAKRPKGKPFNAYCDEKAEQWLNSKLGNYLEYSKEDREFMADKWRNVKILPVGKYEFYFNRGDIKDAFRKSVEIMAENYGITNYILTID